jgi:hypothetical protein
VLIRTREDLGYDVPPLLLLLALIHRSAWKKYSRKFAVAISPARTGVRGSGRGYAGFLSPIGDTLTTFVARNRYERAQVVACELPEKCGVRVHTHIIPDDKSIPSSASLAYRDGAMPNFAFWRFSDLLSQNRRFRDT